VWNKDNGHCTCTPGYYLETCKYVCNPNCLDNKCDIDGSCKCAAGYTGELCQHKCRDTCRDYTNTTQCSLCPVGTCLSQCSNISATGKCSACQTGFYGPRCKLVCPSRCSGGCDVNTGTCYACKTGYAGPECDLHCDRACNSCHQNGTCLHCQLPHMYGDNCTMECSSLCINSTCNQLTGKCSSGCIANHYGANCRMMCSYNCKSTKTGVVCDHKGRCLEGCVQGYTGDDCRTGMSNVFSNGNPTCFDGSTVVPHM